MSYVINPVISLISGTAGGEELWRHCISDTDLVLGFALGSMFVREVFHGESKHKVSQQYVCFFMVF